jgi:DNA gyrase inhibitor GyrI
MKLSKYESDITKFMRELFEKNPQMAAEQQEARAMWWEKPAVTPAEQQRTDASALPQKAYVYFGDK